MKKILLVYALCLILGYSALNANSPKSDLKISVIVPCTYKHVDLLYHLLKIYEQQTVLPHEVIISLSEADKSTIPITKIVNMVRWKFRVKLLVSNSKQYAGTNRNIASENAKGDILVYQDADDLPHPQRIEIIKYFFEHYNIDHLVHHYIFAKDIEELPVLDPHHINFAYQDNDFDSTWKRNPEIHIGCPAITKDVFEQIKWPDTAHREDWNFTRMVYRNAPLCMIIKAPLYIYRNELSSWNRQHGIIKETVSLEDLYKDFANRYAQR